MVWAVTGLSAQETALRQFARQYETAHSMKANVVQTHHNVAFTKDRVTNGHFYYKRPDRYSMLFRESGEMLIASDNQFIKVWNGKQHVAKGKGKGYNPFEIIQEVFRNLLSREGDAPLSDKADVKLEVKDAVCTITIRPAVTNPKEKRRLMFTSCLVSVDLKASELRSLRINERGENYTQYDFSHYVWDVQFGDDVFDAQTMM
ncbi:outer membrane lipoprotein carrier protein LolA [gut metagenome]|uniref:Outer membrane lipoprotein carrier protein LolA n=1 Tax=gut metagenome TaxID=749906 RepID=J9G673_9ZZZZ